jgi:hypothetical protein
MRNWMLLLLGATACGRPEEAPSADRPAAKAIAEADAPAGPDTPEAAIRAYEQAIISNDTAAVAALWDTGPGADTRIRTSQLQRMATDTVTDRLDSATAVSGPEVRMIGDSATASGRIGLYGVEQGKDFHATADYKYSLRKHGGVWKITAAMFYPID